MATARKAPAKRAASQPPMAAKRAGARAPAVHKAGAKRAAPNGAANGAAHQPGLRAAAGKPPRAKVDKYIKKKRRSKGKRNKKDRIEKRRK